jgi:uncharacterized protein YjbI with pentapeptide repeats
LVSLAAAMLVEVEFAGAELDACDLRGANVELADVSQAKGFGRALCDKHTRMPKGWLCVEGTPKAKTE